MKRFFDIFSVNGKPLYAPDEGVQFTYSDLESSDSGYDESGVYHRIVTSYGKGQWVFSYSTISEEEKNYMENLFQNEPDFAFSYPDRLDSSVIRTCRAIRKNTSLSWFNAKTGLWKNYRFTISEC